MVSIISLWEIAIKTSIGKLNLKFDLQELFEKIGGSSISILPIKDRHLYMLTSLPFLHKDPFDRLLVSSALAEGLTIITADETVRRYDVPTIW